MCIPEGRRGSSSSPQRDYEDPSLPQVDKPYIPLAIPDGTNLRSGKETLVNSPRVSSVPGFCLGLSGTGLEREIYVVWGAWESGDLGSKSLMRQCFWVLDSSIKREEGFLLACCLVRLGKRNEGKKVKCASSARVRSPSKGGVPA